MSPFAVKLDENLGQTHVRFLQDLGYQADRVHDEGLSGADDDTVWQKVVSEGRFLITLDLDFSDIRRFQPGSHPVIRLRIDRRIDSRANPCPPPSTPPAT
jgi:predicted nuclease of predicted toxin-antitoxin system